MCDVKKTSTSKRSYATCTVSREKLADSNADFHAKLPTFRDIEDALNDFKNAHGGSSRYARSRELGVVDQEDGVNHFRRYALVDTVCHIPVGRYH